MTEAAANKIILTEEDKLFRKGSTWHAFLGSLYTAFAGAAFFGVLNNLLETGMKMFGPVAAADTGLTLGSTILMASTLAAGAVCTWLAQGEFTELKCIQDERLAHKQAECLMNRQPHEVTAPAPACVIERQKPVQKAALPDTPSPEVMVHDMASRAVACAAQQP